MRTRLIDRTTLNRCTRGGVAISAAALMLSASPVLADEPEIVYLTGKVLDFLQSHPDFNVSTGTGHVANNVALASAENRPEFSGNIGTAGFVVADQWRNKHDDNIAPHLFFNGASLMLGSSPDYNPGNVDFYSWDSSDGTLEPFDEDNQIVGGSLPEVIAPTGLPPHPDASGGNAYNYNVNYSSDTSVVIDYSFQARSLTTGQDVTIEIAPDTEVIIYTTRDFTLGQQSKIVVPETSTLHIYFGQGGLTVGQGCQINMTPPLQPDRCYIYNTGNSNIDFNQTGGICAHIISPNGDVGFHQANDFWGSIIADGLSIDQGSVMHMDGGVEVCGEALADQAGTIGQTSTGAISSSGQYFDQWFTDVPGVNLSLHHTIELHRNSDGIYVYENDAFFPIDGELFGNQGQQHNYNFTFTFSARFEHQQCKGRFFEFEGADDVWVFIDGQLALDLGGVMAMTPQQVEVDRLGLTDGETYTLHFYYAQRNPYMSVFRIRTDLPLESHGNFAVTAPYD